LSYFALIFIGIDVPLFWAFLIFLLNFIPTIGSLIGTLFPALFCLLQFGEITQGISVLAVVGAIQLVIGNIVEPKIMGNSLNLSSFVAIISLSLWGALWGVTGMILSIPITVIIVIILSQFQSTKSIAILLSEKGDLK
jgi:predicted PurR-regulated permease PerM